MDIICFLNWKNYWLYSKLYYQNYTFPKRVNYKSKFSNLTNVSIDKINQLPLLECILELPQHLRVKIGVYCIKSFWKSYIPITNKIPSWYSYKNYIDKELFKSNYQNIHFMHLDFNTLPENKKYILGCQCDFCLTYKNNNIKEVKSMVLEQELDSNYFDKIMPLTSTKWNSKFYSFITTNGFIHTRYIFNPLFNNNI